MIARLLRLTDALAVLGVAALFGVVALGILGRALFDLSGGRIASIVPGGIELATAALGVLVFAGLPRATAAGLMRVDMALHRLPRRAARALERLWALVLAALAGLMGARLLATAWAQTGRGDATQDLGLPLWPLTALAGVLAAGWALTALALALGYVLEDADGPGDGG